MNLFSTIFDLGTPVFVVLENALESTCVVLVLATICPIQTVCCQA